MYVQAMSVLDYIIHQQSLGHLGILLPTRPLGCPGHLTDMSGATWHQIYSCCYAMNINHNYVTMYRYVCYLHHHIIIYRYNNHGYHR